MLLDEGWIGLVIWLDERRRRRLREMNRWNGVFLWDNVNNCLESGDMFVYPVL